MPVGKMLNISVALGTTGIATPKMCRLSCSPVLFSPVGLDTLVELPTEDSAAILPSHLRKEISCPKDLTLCTFVLWTTGWQHLLCIDFLTMFINLGCDSWLWWFELSPFPSAGQESHHSAVAF